MLTPCLARLCAICRCFKTQCKALTCKSVNIQSSHQYAANAGLPGCWFSLWHQTSSSFQDAGKSTWHIGTAAYLIRFLEVILGTLMAAPSRLLPVMKMPLQDTQR